MKKKNVNVFKRGKKTNQDILENLPSFYAEKLPNKDEIDKLRQSSEIKILDLDEYKEYVKQLEQRVNK